jgi:hypothetical protein
MVSKTALFTATTLVFLLGVTKSCVASDSNARELTLEKHYEYNPNTIIETLAEGNESVFIPVDNGTTWYEGDFLETPVNISQDDYLLIAEAVFKLSQSQSLEAWKINSMSFSLMCNEVDYGPQSASFSFIYEDTNILGVSATEVLIYIYPRSHQIDVFKYIYTRSFQKWDSVDANLISLSVEEALSFAENNGAFEKRIGVKNDCEISIILLSKENRPTWVITYFPGVYSLSLDALTGIRVK